jgi:hypothetical protein
MRRTPTLGLVAPPRGGPCPSLRQSPVPRHTAAAPHRGGGGGVWHIEHIRPLGRREPTVDSGNVISRRKRWVGSGARVGLLLSQDEGATWEEVSKDDRLALYYFDECCFTTA